MTTDEKRKGTHGKEALKFEKNRKTAENGPSAEWPVFALYLEFVHPVHVVASVHVLQSASHGLQERSITPKPLA